MYSFGDFEQLGIDHPAKPSPPKAMDAACIMYTSGTTGKSCCQCAGPGVYAVLGLRMQSDIAWYCMQTAVWQPSMLPERCCWNSVVM